MTAPPDKRLSASILLWAKITRGDYLAAPMFLARKQHRPADQHFEDMVKALMADHRRNRGQHGRGAHTFNLLLALSPY